MTRSDRKSSARRQRRWLTFAAAILVAAGGFAASHALQLPRQFRGLADVLAAALAGTTFVITLTALGNFEKIHASDPLEQPRKSRLKTDIRLILLAATAILLATAFLQNLNGLLKQCVRGLDPNDWESKENRKLATLKNPPNSNAKIHTPDFVDPKHHQIFLPLRLPPALQKTLHDRATDPDEALKIMLREDLNELFDDLENSASAEYSSTITLLVALDLAWIMCAAVGLAAVTTYCCADRQPLDAAASAVGRANRVPGQAVYAFISYRREGGAEIARLIRAGLLARGIRTFLDVDDLRSHYFDEQLYREIERAPNFILIVSEGALDGCCRPEDWMRKEVAHALQARRTVIPVIKEGTHMPHEDELPDVLKNLPRYQGVVYSHAYFEAAMDKLESLLRASGDPSPQPTITT